MKELIQKLNRASEAYYSEDAEIMSNFEYDALYDELCALEEKTGVTLSYSPTVNVGYQVADYLPSEDHAYPMLSLDKTKDVSALASFAGDRKVLISWKMDGLTIVLTYNNGELIKGVTRGNGITGEVITPNVKVFKNVPLKISYQGELVIRGEAVIRYSDFEKINSRIEDVESRYKNPRNLCSGTVRQLNSAVTAERNVYLYVFSLVACEGVDFENSHEKEFEWLIKQGFDVVEYTSVTGSEVPDAVEDFKNRIAKNDFPSDGLVALYDDIEYGRSLGTTSKFPRNSIAFKWKDETVETTLKYVEWSPSRTGLINPIAVFEPVEIEGTTVSRASVHNVSILKALKLGTGDRISVYKANMIIPQISENLTCSGTVEIPSSCPVCGEKTQIRREGKGDDAVETLYCLNPACPAKKVLSFEHFVSRDALDVEGLSEATLEKFISAGILHDLSDIFSLGEHRDVIVNMDGFGEKSYENIVREVEKASHTTTAKFIYGLGIPNVGLTTAGTICKAYDNDINRIMQAQAEELATIPTIGGIIGKSVEEWFKSSENKILLEKLLKCVIFENEAYSGDSDLSGLTFVITGSLNGYSNRNELKKLIEDRGGKVASQVTGNTDYLINNDILSNSSKNRKAKELGTQIITEEDFNERFRKD